MLVGQVLTGKLWNLPFMVQRCHHWIFLDNGPLASEAFRCASSSSVPVLWLCWGVGRGETLVLGAAGGQRSFLCACLGFMSSGFGLLSVTPYSLAGSVVAFRHFMMVCFISIFSHPFPRWKGPCSWAFTRHVRYRTSSGTVLSSRWKPLVKGPKRSWTPQLAQY